MPRIRKAPFALPVLEIAAELIDKWTHRPMGVAGFEAVSQKLNEAVIEPTLGSELGHQLLDPDGSRGIALLNGEGTI